MVEALEGMCGVNLFIAEDAEVNVSDAAEDEYILIEIALDSGAGDHVMARVDAPGYEVKESAGSRRGQNFLGAGGHRMPNEGQMILSLLAPSGKDGEEAISSIFQVSGVTRPLWSVSKICDAGYTARFNKWRVEILDDKQNVVCVVERQGGLYVARMKLKNPRHPGFARQGST